MSVWLKSALMVHHYSWYGLACWVTTGLMLCSVRSSLSCNIVVYQFMRTLPYPWYRVCTCEYRSHQSAEIQCLIKLETSWLGMPWQMSKRPTSENEKKRPRPPAPLNPELTWKGCDRRFYKQWCSSYLITYQRIASLTARGNWDVGSIYWFHRRIVIAFGRREVVKHFVIYAKLHVLLAGIRGHLTARSLGCCLLYTSDAADE